MRRTAWNIILYLLIDFAASSDWIVIQPSLPSVTDKHPDSFSLHLDWSEEDKSPASKVNLHLRKSQAVAEQILYFTNDDNGVPSLMSLIDMKHTVFYQDLDKFASISLTNYSGQGLSLQGNFLFNNESYEIEPYHAKVHKRSLGAKEGDHVVRKRSTDSLEYQSDYLEPVPGSQDYDRFQKAQTAFRELQDEEKAGRKKRAANDYVLPAEGSEGAERMKQSRDHLKELLNKNGERKKRNTLPRTPYTVELYIAVDYYLYLKLKESAKRLDWAGGVDDYISFIIAHQINEVDIRYRMINNGSYSESHWWTISTKLSYLNVAKNESASPWTSQSNATSSTLIDGEEGIYRWTHWVKTSILPPADHFMLLTGLNLVRHENISIAGIAFVGGICSENPTSFSEFSSSAVYAHEIGHNDFSNCLLGAGVYIPEWEDSLSGRLRQAIPLDAQCQLAHGKDMYYARTKFDTVCSHLQCTNGSGFIYTQASRDTLQYTSCGNKKWCEKDVCVTHPDAPALDEGCPFEDKDFPQWNVNCSEVTSWECQRSPFRQLYCCRACRVFATPWLGPNCTHGDTIESLCEIVINRTECLYGAEHCCESCCPILGPDEGYSCVQPLPTTTVRTTPTSTMTLPTTTTAASKPTAAYTIKKVTTETAVALQSKAPGNAQEIRFNYLKLLSVLIRIAANSLTGDVSKLKLLKVTKSYKIFQVEEDMHFDLDPRMKELAENILNKMPAANDYGSRVPLRRVSKTIPKKLLEGID
ncbi:uncharacterized protein [Watersipora subatra]|uniref:uncharacterized protein n=1 Tax=Watersipora subatra TaxID=2589382 RepID=UPI00355AE053